MGTYYSRPQDVIRGRVGRMLEGQNGVYHTFRAQLYPGEDLYLAARIGDRWVVVLIDSRAEYDHTYGNATGKDELRFYALPSDVRPDRK